MAPLISKSELGKKSENVKSRLGKELGVKSSSRIRDERKVDPINIPQALLDLVAFSEPCASAPAPAKVPNQAATAYGKQNMRHPHGWRSSKQPFRRDIT